MNNVGVGLLIIGILVAAYLGAHWYNNRRADEAEGRRWDADRD